MERKPVKLQRYLLMLVAWLAVVGLTIGGSYWYKGHQAGKYAATAVPVVKNLVPQIAEWDAAKIRALLAQETLASIPEGNIEKALEVFSLLGYLEQMEEPEFDEVVEVEDGEPGATTLITYEVPTHFSAGDALFKVQLVDRGSHYQLYNFTLSSEVLTGAHR